MTDNTSNPKQPTSPKRSAKLQKYSAPALEKGLEILEFLSAQQNGQSMQHIADGVGRSRNEIFRMMIVLEESGYVERQDSDSFILSDKLYQLGLRRPANKRLTDVALPLMDEFAANQPFCCYLSVTSDAESVVIAKSDSLIPLGLTVTIGHRRPLDQTAEGICLMSFMPEVRRLAILDKLGIDDRNSVDLDPQFQKCRVASASVRPSDLVPSVTNIAVPIFGSIGKNAMAALCVPFMELRRDGVSLEATVNSLRKTADQINQLISHRAAVATTSSE